MADITFSPQETQALTQRIQLYFREELGQELGRFDAEFLLTFISQEMGVYFYNKGLADAQAALTAKLDELCYSISELEKPLETRRR